MADDLARIRDALHGRYAIDREIGRGGMATVYLAEDRKHGRRVAIKVLAPDVAAALGPGRFLREIEVASRLTHPHILPLHDSGEVRGFLYYVMPYIGGESLRERLRRDRVVPTDEAIRIASELAEALGHAHSAGVVHRDVKPENVLLAEGHAVLADFGIAKAVKEARTEVLTDTGLPIGTAIYMSPEQAPGSADVDGRSDLYSLGCVLYEMVAGDPPRFGSTPPAGVPAWLGTTLARALAPSRADRFQTGAELRRALEEGERGGGPVARRGPAPRSIRRTLALGGAAIAAVALAGIALRRQPAPPPAAPDRVLLATFDNETGDPALDPLGDMVADQLFRGLTATGFVRVVDARNERADPGTPRELARELGAGSLVGGRYYRSGDSLVFETQIVDAASGEARCATGRSASPANAASRGVALAQQRVMACFAKLFDPAFVKYEGSVPPPSYEAYLELRAGDDTFFQRCDACPWRAMEHVERAIAIDSTYTAAWTSLAAMSVLMGDCDRAAQIGDRLEPVRDELPPYDRAQLDVSLAACRGAWAAALEAAKRGALAEPHRAGITGWIPLFALILNRPRDALETIASSGWTPLLGRPNPFGWQTGAAYHLLGDHETELKTARLARYASPDDMFTLQNEIVALAALGRGVEVETRVEELLAHPAEESYMGSPGNLMVRAGLELRAHGHPELARTLFERAVEWHRAHPLVAADIESLVVAGPWRGQALDLTGRWDEERALFEWILESKPADVEARGALGALAARRGDRRGAAEADAWLARQWAESPEGGARAVISYERASIAAVLGEKQQAIDLLRRAIGEGYAFISADYTFPFDVDPDLDSLRDDPAFRRLVEPKG